MGGKGGQNYLLALFTHRPGVRPMIDSLLGPVLVLISQVTGNVCIPIIM